jgi:hypothetical protein
MAGGTCVRSGSHDRPHDLACTVLHPFARPLSPLLIEAESIRHHPIDSTWRLPTSAQRRPPCRRGSRLAAEPAALADDWSAQRRRRRSPVRPWLGRLVHACSSPLDPCQYRPKPRGSYYLSRRAAPWSRRAAPSCGVVRLTLPHRSPHCVAPPLPRPGQSNLPCRQRGCRLDCPVQRDQQFGEHSWRLPVCEPYSDCENVNGS